MDSLTGGVEVSLPYCWYIFLFMWGKVGVNVFVLISGYYLIDTSETVDFHKAAKIIGQLLFYSISISCVLLLLGESKIDLTFIKNTFFPITFSSWWFASAYFVLYLAHPYINILLKRLTPVAFQKIIAIMLMLWCVIPTFFGSQYQSNYFLWFVTLYVLASYLDTLDSNWIDRINGLDELPQGFLQLIYSKTILGKSA